MTDSYGTAHGKVSTYNKGCRCDPCRAVKAAASREAYRRNGEKIRARNLAWYYANAEYAKAQAQQWQSENREKVRGYVTQWRAKNPEWERQWVSANPDKVAAKARRWRDANSELLRQRRATERFKRQGAETFLITPNDWRRLCLRYDNACCYCGDVKPLTMDHVIPLVRGGRNSIGNVVPACGSCNSSKHNRLIVEWRAAQRRAA